MLWPTCMLLEFAHQRFAKHRPFMWFWKRTSPTLTIPEPRRQEARSGTTISTVLDGRRIWFSSSDAELVPSSEAYGSLLLIPAVYSRRRLALEAPVCGLWRKNVEQLLPVVGQWSETATERLQATERVVPPRRQPAATALCFSCGVDSFFSLLRESRRADLLICALGYDVELGDRLRCESIERAAREVAAELGRRVVVVSSNLRQHRLLRKVSWQLTHGGALAALGHLLSSTVERLMISSSRLIGNDEPFGSRWDIDPYFSSAEITIDHVGATFQRTEKLRSIAREAIVRQHLRVCWENRGEESNCGRCEKCVRTMLILESCGELGNYPTFRGGKGLLECLNQIPHVIPARQLVYESLLALGLSEPYRSAVQRLVERTRIYHGR